jgi:hypothetical protein
MTSASNSKKIYVSQWSVLPPFFVFTMQDGKIAIMYAASNGLRDLVQILFPTTKPIASLPNWSVDGIIDTMKYTFFKYMVYI